MLNPPNLPEFWRLVQDYGHARACQARGEPLHHAEKFEAAVVDAYRQRMETDAAESLRADAEKYRALATPEIHDFMCAVEREALHQRDRWGVEHDGGKADSDWFWLIGYLAGKALNAGKNATRLTPEQRAVPALAPMAEAHDKMLHHIITTAAACLNWHAAKLGTHKAMRPGISGETQSCRSRTDDRLR